MNTDDIDSTAPAAEKRWTSHVFQTNPDRFIVGSLRPGSRLRINDSADYPPAIIFDIVYATVIFRHFGTPSLRDSFNSTWKDKLYPHGVMTAAQGDHQATIKGRGAGEEKKRKQNEERAERHRKRNRQVEDALDMIMIMPYIMMPPEEVDRMMREAEEKAEAERRRCVEEKVGAWLKHINV
jgi:hypothetical protein